MDFTKKLSDALKIVPVAEWDKRLDVKSDLKRVESSTEKGPRLDPVIATEPDDVYSNFGRKKTWVTEDVASDVEKELETDENLPVDDVTEPVPEDEESEDEGILDSDIPEREHIPGTPSGSGYTVKQAKGQLDGIIKQWLMMAGNYPEGEQRHNFLEIGERLREISGVLQRDFLSDEP